MLDEETEEEKKKKEQEQRVQQEIQNASDDGQGTVTSISLTLGGAFVMVGGNVEIGLAVNENAQAIIYTKGGYAGGHGYNGGLEIAQHSGDFNSFTASHNDPEFEVGAGGLALNLRVNDFFGQGSKTPVSLGGLGNVHVQGGSAGIGNGFIFNTANGWNIRSRSVNLFKVIPRFSDSILPYTKE